MKGHGWPSVLCGREWPSAARLPEHAAKIVIVWDDDGS
jgi:hypothetical protein